MSQLICPACGASVGATDTECKYCGEKLSFTPAAEQQVQQMQSQQQFQQPQPQAQTQVVIQQAPQQVYMTAINPAWPIKSKVTAGILAILLGGIGVHKFYMGKIGMGIVYLLFCWTGIPAIVGVIEGIMYLCSNDENFQLKNHVRIG